MSDHEDYSDPNEQQTIDDEVEQFIDQESSDIAPISLDQHTLLSYATSNDVIWTKVSRILDADYFDGEYKRVVKFVKEYVAKYKKLPSRLNIKTRANVSLETPEDHMDQASMDYVCDELEKHCKSRFSDIAALEIVDINSGEKTGDIQAVIKETYDRLMRMTLNRDLGFEIHDNVLEQLQYAESHDSIPTGFKLIDRALGGGTTRPSFNLVSAGSGFGKSVYLQNQAVNYVERGHNVLYITLELIPPLVAKRYSAIMTNTHIDHVYRLMEEIAVQMKKRGRTEGRLWVTKLPMSNTSPEDIEALYHDVCREHGVRYDCIIIDYIDVMTTHRAGIKLDNIHLRDKFIAEDLNDFIHRLDLIGWSASQQTKSADDDKNARQSSVSGGQPKISTLDNLIILKRSEDDMADQRMWAHMSKGRSGGSMLKIPLTFNRDTLKMGDGSENDFYEANPWFFGKKKGESSGNGHSERVTKDPILGKIADRLPPAEKDKEPGVSKSAASEAIKARLKKKEES